MKIAFYGSSLLSAYWNGAATYYRGMLKALSARGYEITFYEPDAFDRQSHRDIDPPEWCRVMIYEASIEGLKKAAALAASADIVIKASGVGYEDDILLQSVLDSTHADALTIFWDVDAPATLSELQQTPDHPLRHALADIDLVLTYGGGDPVVRQYEALGAKSCRPIYNALDPDTHHPVPKQRRFKADMAFLGNRLPDREARVESFFLEPAAALPMHDFLLGGSGWEDKPMRANVRYIGHVPTSDHNAFNTSAKAVLNISRSSMATNGFSPATRVFEAAGAGACLITDYWEGIEQFLEPGKEVLVARDGQEVAEIMRGLTGEEAERIGQAALARVLRDHTYAERAAIVDDLLRSQIHALRGAA
ncbi:glycosyltransferase [Rhizobium sp. L1K21]|uniref:CgeB family protein n=1 Tax=Rhizobium sp. L1K21 TaxID=2954933 RepID=UPI002092688B|nr:glycosyltransferase [Rhizobium sp. L1K21]MCO6187813.1 glycosyltransferase [Rhizobium sp. L1K21]